MKLDKRNLLSFSLLLTILLLGVATVQAANQSPQLIITEQSASTAVTPQSISPTTPISWTMQAVDETGNTFANNGQCWLNVYNGSANTVYVTITVPASPGGLVINNVSYTITTMTMKTAGPFNPIYYNNGSGNVTVNYDTGTSVNVAVLKFPQEDMMTTPADFTTRTRAEMFNIYTVYQSLAKRINDLNDEVTARGGTAGIYGATGANWPTQGDGFTENDIIAAFNALITLIGTPTTAQKQAIIKARQD